MALKDNVDKKRKQEARRVEAITQKLYNHVGSSVMVIVPNSLGVRVFEGKLIHAEEFRGFPYEFFVLTSNGCQHLDRNKIQLGCLDDVLTIRPRPSSRPHSNDLIGPGE